MNGFVLSGGGNLGSLQVGMLKAMLQAEIAPGVLVGTSIGSFNAAFLAADPSVDRAEALCDIWRNVRARDFFSANPFRAAAALTRRGAFFSSDRWRAFLERHIPYSRIEDAAVALRITATDFASGAPVILDSGSVVDAVMASTCLPGIFPPHRIGKDLYLDGVLSDQVSLQPAIDAGADTLYVLAVSAAKPSPEPGSPRAVLRHSLTILLFPRIRLEAIGLPSGHENLRIVQVPSVGAQVGLWDMSQHGRLIDEAYEETAAFLRGCADTAEDERLEVASVPELTVEVDLPTDMAPETRSAQSGK